MVRIWTMVAIFALVGAAAAPAATLLETRDEDGTTQQVYFEGTRMRAQEAGAAEYMLVDAGSGKMYLVNTEDRQVMDLSAVLAEESEGESAPAPTPALDVAKVGAGPEVAGYPTEHYVIRVDGRKCSDEYLSRKALADLDVADFLSLMADLDAASNGGPGEAWEDPCDRAESALEKQYARIGVPLRVVEADGTVSTEVLRIVSDAAVPPGGFALPKDYPVVDYGEMMRRALPPPGADGAPEGMDPAEFQKLMEQMMKQQQGQP